MKVSFFTCVLVLVLAILALTTAQQLNVNVLKQQFHAIAKDAYDINTQGFSNTHTLFKQQELFIKLGMTGNFATQNTKYCPKLNEYYVSNIVPSIHYMNTHHLQQHESQHILGQILSFSELVHLFQCRSIEFSVHNDLYKDTIVQLLLQDSLYDVYVGVKLVNTLIQLNSTIFSPQNVDWVDIIDLTSSLILSADGFSRSSITTIAASHQNTIYIGEIVNIILSNNYLPVGSLTPATLEKVQTIYNAFVSLNVVLCPHTNDSITTSLTINDYNTYLIAYTNLHALLKIEASIPLPLQCITSIVTQSLFSIPSTPAEAIYSVGPIVEYLTTTLYSILNNHKKSIKITDLIAPNSLVVYVVTNSNTIIDVASKKVSFDLFYVPINPIFTGLSTNVEKINDAVIKSPHTTLNVALKPVSNTRLPPKQQLPQPITISVESDHFLKHKSIQFPSLSPETHAYGTYVLTIFTPGPDNMTLFSTRMVLSAVTPVKQNTSQKDNISYLINQIMYTTPSEISKNTKKFSTTPLKLMTQDHHQITFFNNNEMNKNDIYGLRIIACDTAAQCSSASLIDLNSKPLSQQFTTYFNHHSGDIADKNKAFLFLTASDFQSFLKTNDVKSFVIILDSVSLKTYTTTSTILTTVELTNNVIDRDAIVDPHINDNYLWSIIPRKFYTFNDPHPLPHPIITTVFTCAIIGLSVLSLGYFLFVFRPVPNFSNAAKSNNSFAAFIYAIMFTSVFGLSLFGIFVYWWGMTLFQIMIPAGLAAIPFTIIVWLALKESVGSMRLYELLYITTPEQPAKAQKTKID